MIPSKQLTFGKLGVPQMFFPFRSTKILSLVTTGALLGFSIPVYAQSVDQKIHKLCIEAKDYAGCVRAMKGEDSGSQRVINQQGADVAEGNECPSGYAYVGGGNCKEVICRYNGLGMGHDPRVAGKPGWGCKWSWMYGGGELRLEGNARTAFNKNCPVGEPQIGYNSTCTTAADK